MSSRLPVSIVGGVAACLVAASAVHAAPNDLDRSFGARGITIDPRVATADGDLRFLGLQLFADGRSTVAMSSSCGMSCGQLRIVRSSRTGAPVRTPDSWRILPVDNDDDGAPAPDRLTGWRSLADGGLLLTYMGGDPGTWGPHDQRGLLADAPAGPFSLRLPADGGVGTIAALPWRFEPVDAMTGGGYVGWAPDGWVGMLTSEWAPVAGFGPAGRLRIPEGFGAAHGLAGGDVVRVGGGDARALRLWTVTAGADGWAGPVTATTIPRPRGAVGRQDGPGGVDVAPDGRSIVWRVLVGRSGSVTTATAAFAADGTPDHAFGSRGLVRTGGRWIPRIQADGKVVLTSFAGWGKAKQIRVRRLNVDGSPDPSFPVTGVSPRGFSPNGGETTGLDGRGRILVTQGLARVSASAGTTPVGMLMARLRGGDAAVLKLTRPRRIRANAVRLTATASTAGAARIVVRRSRRVVGARTVRFAHGSRKVVTVTLRRGGRAPLSVTGTLRRSHAGSVR